MAADSQVEVIYGKVALPRVWSVGKLWAYGCLLTVAPRDTCTTPPVLGAQAAGLCSLSSLIPASPNPAAEMAVSDSELVSALADCCLNLQTLSCLVQWHATASHSACSPVHLFPWLHTCSWFNWTLVVTLDKTSVHQYLNSTNLCYSQWDPTQQIRKNR